MHDHISSELGVDSVSQWVMRLHTDGRDVFLPKRTSRSVIGPLHTTIPFIA